MKKVFLLVPVLLGILVVVSSCNQPPPPAGGGPTVIELEANQWGWTPETITVNQGDEVRLVITSTAEVDPDFSMHGFALEGYSIYEILPVGETTVVEFVADRAGSFPFLCNILCGAGHLEMTGTLKVE